MLFMCSPSVLVRHGAGGRSIARIVYNLHLKQVNDDLHMAPLSISILHFQLQLKTALSKPTIPTSTDSMAEPPL